MLLEPKNAEDKAFVIEFKVHEPSDEKSLSDTVKAALEQIESKKYTAVLESRGIQRGRIRKYGFAFEGKTVVTVHSVTSNTLRDAHKMR